MSSPTSSPTTPAPQKSIDEPPAIWELVDERPFGSPSATDWTDGLYESRHNEDFRTRNQRKVLQVETWLSDFALLLRSASRSEDQQAFMDLHNRVRLAAEGISRHARKPSEDLDSKIGNGSPMRVREGDFWRVRHSVAESSTLLSVDEKAEKVKEMARKTGEARAKWDGEAEEQEKRWIESGEQGYLDDFEDDWEGEDWKGVEVGSGETTLVDDETELEVQIAAVKVDD